MLQYDIIVIGAGAGMRIAFAAHQQKLKVALIENGPIGGTCLNRGCIPTKILTSVADYIVQLDALNSLGVKTKIENIDYPWIMKRMRKKVDEWSIEQAKGIEQTEGVDWYHGTGEFVEDYVVEVNGQRLTANKIFISAGSRPLIPEIKGLEDTEYLTNDEAMHLMEQPKSMIIIGGGYIAAEFGHFFSAVGTKVTILGRNQYLIKDEDHDVSEMLCEQLSKRMTIETNHEVIEVREEGNLKVAVARNKSTNETKEFKAEVLLVATGRRSNSDLFKPEKTGVEVDENGWIIVDDYLRTSKKDIWALGDALGRHLFRHVANQEAKLVLHNLTETFDGAHESEMKKMSYHAVARGVFSYPPIAAVGMTLKEAKESGHELLVTNVDYDFSVKGFAIAAPPSLVRVIVDADSKKLLGACVVGPHAQIMIQEITTLMNTPEGTYLPMVESIHIHPSLIEIMQRAMWRLAPLKEEDDN
ncbi:MAG: dihydrolipoyl dehydrogenase [Candidatus Thorarchaeota archaeon]